MCPSAIFNGDGVKILKDKLKFKTTGEIHWDAANGCPAYDSDVANVTNQIGQETHLKVYNGTGSPIPNGAVVYIMGIDPDNIHPSVALAIANTYHASRVIGVVTATIPDGSHGVVTRDGIVNNLDTSSYTSGDRLYLSSSIAGAMTLTAPTDGDFPVMVGNVCRVDATQGSIVVEHIANEYTAETTQKTGWSQFGMCTLSFVDGALGATRTLTLTPVGTDFHFYQAGIKYEKTTDSIQISDVEGLHVIYYNLGVLVDLLNPTPSQIDSVIRNNVTVAYVYWDFANRVHNYLGTELHDMQFPSIVHSYNHFAYGARYLNGLGLTNILSEENGSLASHAQFGVEEGAITDEDIYLPSPAIASTTGLPIFYLSGTSIAPTLRKITNAGYSVSTTGTGRLAYNFLTGGNWTIAEIGNLNYVLCHVFEINENTSTKRMVAFMGQASYATVALARDGATTEVLNLQTFGILPQEKKSVATIIFQTSNGYANAVKARIREVTAGVDYVDWRATNTTGGGVAGGGTISIFSDSLFQVYDDVDPTKSIKFQASGITTGTTKVITAADRNVTLGDITDWATSTHYTTTSCVKYTDERIYRCSIDHTSGVFATDLAAVKWVAISTNNHNDTASRQGGNATESYHLTSAQHTVATQASTDALNGYLSAADHLKFNTVTEFDFLKEKVIGDFSIYDDGDTATPVDGTGDAGGAGDNLISVAASPSPISTQNGVLNLRISKSATGSARGEGVSVPFSTRGLIDRAAMRVCKISILSSANYIDNAFGCYLFDVTNSRLIYPADQNIKASSFVSSQQFEFQLSPDSDSYRLIFHCQDATVTSAYDLDCVVKFVENKNVTGMLPDRQYDLTVTSGQSGFAVVRAIGVPYKTKDGVWRLRFNISTTFTLASVSGGTISISGVVFKTTSNGQEVGGTAGGSLAVSACLAGPGSGNITITHATGNANAWVFSGDVELDSKPTWAIDTSIAILGQDAGQREISFSAKATGTAQSIAHGAFTRVTFGSTIHDKTGSWDGSVFTAQESGRFFVNFQGEMASAANLVASLWGIRKNGSALIYSTSFTDISGKAQISLLVDMLKGETIDVAVYQETSGSAARDMGVGASVSLQIFKISSPQQIAASEKVYAEYTTASGQFIANSDTVINYDSKVIDSHNAVTTGAAWNFKAPKSSVYNLNMLALIGSRTWTSGNFAYAQIYKNGTAYKFLTDITVNGNFTGYMELKGSTGIYLNIDDYITVYGTQTEVANQTLIANAALNWITIESE